MEMESVILGTWWKVTVNVPYNNIKIYPLTCFKILYFLPSLCVEELRGVCAEDALSLRATFREGSNSSGGLC